jgi:NAD(P) transhydrogenase subunit beta
VTGALVGASGAILSYIMCKGMNRCIINVLLGGFGRRERGGGWPAARAGDRAPVKAGSPEDAAYIMKNAQKIIVVPGYGMAVAQAQQVVREMADLLKKEGAESPTPSTRARPHARPHERPAGRGERALRRGARARGDQRRVRRGRRRLCHRRERRDQPGGEDRQVQRHLRHADPRRGAREDGVLRQARHGSGYAGVENELFFRPNTMMLFGDAKKVTQEIVQALQR